MPERLLHTQILPHRYPTDQINVGNTGLYFTFDTTKSAWQIHFAPEGKTSATKSQEKRKQYALTCLYGLYHFMTWWAQASNWPDGQIRPGRVHGSTNLEMFSFLQRNLGASVQKLKQRGYTVDDLIDLEHLEKDLEVMERLQEASIACKNMHFEVRFGEWDPDLSPNPM